MTKFDQRLTQFMETIGGLISRLGQWLSVTYRRWKRGP
jgi:hypothetical protein